MRRENRKEGSRGTAALRPGSATSNTEYINHIPFSSHMCSHEFPRKTHVLSQLMRQLTGLRRRGCSQLRALSQSPRARQKSPSEDGAQLQDIDLSSRTINTPAGRLPISPLMDEGFLAARRRWKAPKATPDAHGKTKWQRLLARNPYGRVSLSCPSPIFTTTYRHVGIKCNDETETSADSQRQPWPWQLLRACAA